METETTEPAVVARRRSCRRVHAGSRSGTLSLEGGPSRRGRDACFGSTGRALGRVSASVQAPINEASFHASTSRDAPCRSDASRTRGRCRPWAQATRGCRGTPSLSSTRGLGMTYRVRGRIASSCGQTRCAGTRCRAKNGGASCWSGCRLQCPRPRDTRVQRLGALNTRSASDAAISADEPPRTTMPPTPQRGRGRRASIRPGRRRRT